LNTSVKAEVKFVYPKFEFLGGVKTEEKIVYDGKSKVEICIHFNYNQIYAYRIFLFKFMDIPSKT
jgi:hypothetical protein